MNKLLRELDAEVAEHVMGEEVFYPDGPSVPWQNLYNKRRTDTIGIEEVPYYSTDIAATWRVVEKSGILSGMFLWQPFNNQDWAIEDRFSPFDDEPFVRAKTALLAICLAALKAVGRDTSKYEELIYYYE